MQSSVKLLIAQACERSGYYLVIDMIGTYAAERLGWQPHEAMLLGGLLGGTAYVGPIFGGAIADKVIGCGAALLAGCTALLVGYTSLAAGAPIALVALLMAIGNGLYKPSATATCGKLAAHGQRQDAMYKFYMAINVGAIAAPIIGETMRALLGWSAAFYTAAGLLCVTMAIVRSRSVQAAANGLIAYLPSVGPEQRRLYAPERTLYWLYGIVTVFWTGFNQFNGTLTFWARDWTDRHLLWFTIPPTVFAALNSMYIIVFGARPALWFERRGLSFRFQLEIGMVIMAFSYVLMMLAAIFSTQGHASMLWLVAAYGAMSLSEILISPAMLTLIAEAVPSGRTAMHMGLWFGTSAVGHYAAGAIGYATGALGYAWVFSGLAAMMLFGAAGMRRLSSGIKEVSCRVASE